MVIVSIEMGCFVEDGTRMGHPPSVQTPKKRGQEPRAVGGTRHDTGASDPIGAWVKTR